jgi:hypothetical protein
MAGRFDVAGDVVTFTPSFPFDPEVRYRVLVDARSLPGGSPAAVTAVVERPAPRVTSPLATVISVVPGGTAMPANVLRVYVHFSAPMGPRSGGGTVRLLDDTGLEIDDPFLPLEAELWNADRTRYTLFFDPGRVKTGIRPNIEMGRALERGRFYSLVIDDDWLDAHGRPLAAPYHHEFWAGAPVEEPLDPARWRIATPRAGTRDALIVTFPHPLDEGLLARAIGVERRGASALGGDITLAPDQTDWRFTPEQPWQAGAHRLAVLGILEDPSGNRIGRAFELEATRSSKEIERTTVPFMIAP